MNIYFARSKVCGAAAAAAAGARPAAILCACMCKASLAGYDARLLQYLNIEGHGFRALHQYCGQHAAMLLLVWRTFIGADACPVPGV
jgi:hypothetical protein